MNIDGKVVASPPLSNRGMRIFGSKPRNMATPSPNRMNPNTTVTQGSELSIWLFTDDRSTPKTRKTRMKPAVRTSPTNKHAEHGADPGRGALVHAGEEREVRRQHGEPARVDGGEHAGSERQADAGPLDVHSRCSSISPFRVASSRTTLREYFTFPSASTSTVVGIANPLNAASRLPSGSLAKRVGDLGGVGHGAAVFDGLPVIQAQEGHLRRRRWRRSVRTRASPGRTGHRWRRRS